jgi:esterase/lipase
MIAYRIKYKNIISELFLPSNPSGIVLIILPGLPSYLGKHELAKKLVKKGITIFQPFYSGSFDSDGDFNPINAIKDVDTIVQMVKKETHKELYFGKTLKYKVDTICLAGISFGSSIVALSSNKTIDNMILISPVLSYDQKFINEVYNTKFNFSSQTNGLINLITKGYSHTYRIGDLDLFKNCLLGKVAGFNPVVNLTKVNKKMLILHGENDNSIPCELTQILLDKFKINNEMVRVVIIPKAEHSISSFCDQNTVDILYNFLNKHKFCFSLIPKTQSAPLK